MEIKVFIINELQMIREGIRAMLAGFEDLSIIGSAADYQAAKNSVAQCDVLLLEQNENPDEVLEKVNEIQKLAPEVKIILLFDRYEEPAFLNKMLNAGISGCITKNAGPEELYYGIKKVFEDGLYLCTAFILKFLEKLPAAHLHKTPPLAVRLSAGETDVLNLISEGLTNKEIALKLFVSVRTVETRRKNLLAKTGTTNTATLIKFCLKAGMI